MRIVMAAVLAVAIAACGGSKDDKKPAGGSGSASGSGSATSMAGGSGAGSAGSGSATTMAGGSDTGSAMAGGSGGSAMAGGSGGGSAVAMTGSNGSGAGSAGGGSAAWDFDKLDHKAQADFMKDHVMPDMKVAFQAFDAKKFAKFDCMTCHGKNAKANHFKMPTPDIPALDFAAIQAGKQAPKMAEFMEKTVKPQMAKILQQPEFDPVAKTGKFGCLACHQMKK